MTITTLAAAIALLAPAPDFAPNAAQTPYAAQSGYQTRVLSDADAALFRQGLEAARARDVARTQSVIAQIGDPTARKLVLWALIDTSGPQLTLGELVAARRDMASWPRSESRNAAAEAALEMAYPDAQTVLAFFGGAQPETAQGAIALAGALEQTGRTAEAQALVRDWWRNRSFEEAQQTRILTRWGPWLTQADHEARLNMLLLGPHGPATRAMVDLVSPERQAVANAVIGLRGAYQPDAFVANLTPAQAADPAVALERVRLLRAADRESEGFALLAALPSAPSHDEGQDTLWTERRNYFIDALALRNWRAAYDAMAGHGFPGGERKVDAEFFAGWVALTKLNDPVRAAQHFETLRQSSQTPITQGRALYWLGRAAEAQGDASGAQAWYAQGARHIQSFYGQLAAEKAGVTTLTLPPEVQVTGADQARFEANELVRATRILGETGEMSLYRVFAYELDNQLTEAADFAQLIDMTRGYGDWFASMMVGRAASQAGFILPERQYPIRIPEQRPGSATLPFTLAITRQESSFDPRVVSSAGARGMMQFLPSTASGVARRLGMPYSADRLFDADYNMTLGSYHLGELMSQFGGSMLLTAVGYNAGPARPPQWIARCGDPRGEVDPIDFIECAPFTETRNYMMRVMENHAIYKARLNGGSAPLTPSADIAMGAAAGPRPYTP
ncbi:lytic transglycosylase domain-containing protein [Brevundimonas balnearis]|uniref:Transglycosylase SLT domain-containing protein n=1 Tax=Brevundimonas balnearis TaxID=1572858 RepID=A0ABV6QYP8_9CAUL